MSENLFKLKSKYSPSWDQQNAIDTLSKNIDNGKDFQTLWWVTWSGKTFTMANLINKVNKPTLVIAHNKTLAAQLANEFKEFFPDNSVHYFVSYYDYYQPEAYVAKTDTYIEKEATINAEIDRLRHAATQDLLTRKDVIIVASVSCIYGLWDIEQYKDQVFQVEVGKEYKIEDLLKKLVNVQFKRAWSDFWPGNFQVMWDLLEIYPSSSETVYSIEFWWDEVSQITNRNYLTWEIYEYLNEATIFPAKHTVTSKDKILEITEDIQKDLDKRLKYFKEDLWDVLKYERLKTKVEYDLEMMKEVWYVNWIENYSSYLDWRKPWTPPATLMDYFWKDYLTLVDESHMTFSQIWGMYAWDRARKTNLVENGFRLPSAMDNRPLKFNEFESKVYNVVAVSATPNKYEIAQSCDWSFKNNDEWKWEYYDTFYSFDPIKDWLWKATPEMRIVPQVIRPTWLLDPEIILKQMEFMVDDIMKNISEIVENDERMLITTITKKSSEELTDYLLDNWVKVKYLHSEVETLERIEILQELRKWEIDVIVWVNLLREWLDLPEVSKICILDADKQGFLRSESALIQIIWRAARNAKGKVYMYSEQLKTFSLEWSKWIITTKTQNRELIREKDGLFRIDKAKSCNDDWLVVSEAMKKAINLNYYRRWLQIEHNEKNWITPKTVYSTIKDMWIKTKNKDNAILDKRSAEKELQKLDLEMDIAAANMEYEKAAEIRDRIIEIKKWTKK